RCVLSWETNRQCEEGRRSLALNGRFCCVPNSRFVPLEGTAESADASAKDRAPSLAGITFPQSQLEVGLLSCPLSFGGDPVARPPSPRQKSNLHRAVDHISVLVCPLFRSSSPSFVAS